MGVDPKFLERGFVHGRRKSVREGVTEDSVKLEGLDLFHTGEGWLAAWGFAETLLSAKR